MKRIASNLPGRIRIRDEALRDASALARAAQQLADHDGVLGVRGNAGAASLVVRYDVTRTDSRAIERAVAALIGRRVPAPGSKRFRLRVNRYAKYGALASLGVSLALAAAGRKRLHTATGIAFLLCLGVHMGIHRRALLR